MRGPSDTVFGDHNDRIQLNPSLSAIARGMIGNPIHCWNGCSMPIPRTSSSFAMSSCAAATLTDRLWAVVEQPPAEKASRRLRAAAALAAYDPGNPRWSRVHDRVVDDFVTVPTVYLSQWMKLLEQVKDKLEKPLTLVFRDGTRRESDRYMATDILADYVADRPHPANRPAPGCGRTPIRHALPKIKQHDGTRPPGAVCRTGQNRTERK